jgi:hypothetical protein
VIQVRKALNRLADQILAFDEASLSSLLDEYRQKMDSFEPTREWERAVIIFFIINSMRVKNLMFNENILKKSAKGQGEEEAPRKPSGDASKKKPRPGRLKRVK